MRDLGGGRKAVIGAQHASADPTEAVDRYSYGHQNLAFLGDLHDSPARRRQFLEPVRDLVWIVR